MRTTIAIGLQRLLLHQHIRPLYGSPKHVSLLCHCRSPVSSLLSSSAASRNTAKMGLPRPPPDITTPPQRTLHLPRILCLHGGGVNAQIFHSQMRSVLAHPSLSDRFRFVFIDAPFECAEGVGISPVYDDWGPFRRWFRWLESHQQDVKGVEAVHEAIWGSIREGMEKDDGTGEWVGLWGFSQGAKLVGSLLGEQQMRVDEGRQTGLTSMDKEGKKQPVMWKFGVLLAGRCPFAALSAEGEKLAWLQSAAGLPAEADCDAISERPDMKLRVPTVHVHGLRDEGLDLHRRVVKDYCAPLTTTVVEWDGPHRVPIKKTDVEKVVQAMVELVEEYGY
jgi:hypothetical protein